MAARNNLHRFFLSFVLIAALVSGAISPACKFVRGEVSLIEICTAFGLKTVEMPAAPYKGPAHKIVKECPFCIAHHQIKSIKPDLSGMVAAAVRYQSPAFSGASSAVLRSYRARDYAPRDPPFFS